MNQAQIREINPIEQELRKLHGRIGYLEDELSIFKHSIKDKISEMITNHLEYKMIKLLMQNKKK